MGKLSYPEIPKKVSFFMDGTLINHNFRSLTDAYWNSSKLLRKSVSDCESYPILNEVIDEFAKSIKKSLATVTPEFRPVRCSSAFLFDAPQIETKVEEIIKYVLLI